ncbi:unnamed protein product [Rotaria sp. Silwood1]|nr:unnamed protein product [Rotaria sp. Silwood1]CAF1598822.1 unnamed protein product [Rotaria sp. Silwood1]CAF3767949.1 unnamed protein product [Rotaria sp. Silwood1]CAF4775683.1 unnamed protein product [Rotaria sp. Silwood1]CAF4821655.1 unnamed protein product [Rotaria sp. Silwood1]
MIDFDHGVDRTYITNRRQAQFIGQDLLSDLHFNNKKIIHRKYRSCFGWKRQRVSTSDEEQSDSDMSIGDQSYEFDKLEIISRQRKHALEDREKKLVDSYVVTNNFAHGYPLNRWRIFSRDDIIGYRENSLKQIDQDSGTSLCRIAMADCEVASESCRCGLGSPKVDLSDIEYSTVCYNHLIFDFDTHQLVVERLSDEMPHGLKRHSLLYDCIDTLRSSLSDDTPILFYRVNIEKLAKTTSSFNHASCQCYLPEKAKIDEFSFLDYTYLSDVHLAIGQNNDHIFVLSTYCGVAAL